MKNFNAVSHNRARHYFRIQHGRGEVRARRVYLNVHSVTGNVVDTEWSVEFWRWKYCREFWNNTYGRARLWDTASKFFTPVLRITSPDHLVTLVILSVHVFLTWSVSQSVTSCVPPGFSGLPTNDCPSTCEAEPGQENKHGTALLLLQPTCRRKRPGEFLRKRVLRKLHTYHFPEHPLPAWKPK